MERIKNALFCLLPAVIFSCLFIFLLSAGLTADLKRAGILILFILFLTGRICSSILNKRCGVARFLLFLNPVLLVREALQSGYLITEHDRLLPFFLSLRIAAWQLLSVLLLPIPYTMIYIPALRAALYDKLYRSA